MLFSVIKAMNKAKELAEKALKKQKEEEEAAAAEEAEEERRTADTTALRKRKALALEMQGIELGYQPVRA